MQQEQTKIVCIKSVKILDIVVNDFRTNYIPDKEITLDEVMLGWRGRLRFRVYNRVKITKYGILVRIVCESSAVYVCNLQIYDGVLYYVTSSKNSPNSRTSFLDFMSGITENLIHTSDAVSSPSSSCDESQRSSRTPTPTPTKRPPKK